MTQATDIARSRQGLYRFFGSALRYPDPAQLDVLRAAVSYLENMGMDDFAYYAAWRRFTDAFPSTLDSDALAVEYVRLFASGTDGALCPPIESFYVARAEGGGIAENMAALQRTYRELGLSTKAGGESPDHASAELEVLSVLCGREAERWSAEDLDEVARLLARQHMFLRTHLMAWFPQFRGKIAATGTDLFYPGVVEATYAFLVHDVDWTKAVLRNLEAGS
jgi:TorA maturation chaperone TorD